MPLNAIFEAKNRFLAFKFLTGNRLTWSIHKFKNIDPRTAKNLAGDWSNLFWLFTLSSFSKVLYINTL